MTLPSTWCTLAEVRRLLLRLDSFSTLVQCDALVFPAERVKLKRSDYPLVLRVIQGPCEQVCKVFLMEEDLGEEVTYDVSLLIFFFFIHLLV